MSVQLPPIVTRDDNPVYDSSTPRSVIKISGQPYLPVRWETHLNGHGATDDASFTLSIKGNPDFSAMFAQSGTGAIVPIPVEIWAGFPKNPTPGSLSIAGMSRRFLGNLDLYEASPDANEITFTCRSLAAPLVDQKMTNAPMNMTSVDFAKQMAKALGLTFNSLLLPGTQPITIQQMLGRQFIGGPAFNSAVYNLHPWDILLQCALFDDTDVWVDGDMLNYCSPALIQRNNIAVPYGSLLREPRLSHSVQFNKNIRVEVRVWNTHTKTSTVVRADGDPASGITITSASKSYTSTPIFGTPAMVTTSTTPTGTSATIATAAGGAYKASPALGSEPTKQIYKFYRKNLSPDQANNLAANLWRQYSAQEYSIEFGMQMTSSLLSQIAITSLFNVGGLPYSEFNQLGPINSGYYPRKITETYDPKSGGWRIDVTAINLVLPSGSV